MVVYHKTMANFGKCAETGKAFVKDTQEIIIIESVDGKNPVWNQTAYSLESQKAAWLLVHGTVNTEFGKKAVKPVAVKAPVVAQTVPVMASMIHDEHPAPLASKKPRAIVMKSEAGTVVFYPAR